ncbi:hypothetical protein KKE14_02885 [Patescibacteria group bacterium]|nr:hypothetical protein [Patescibacteria group bacterium]
MTPEENNPARPLPETETPEDNQTTLTEGGGVEGADEINARVDAERQANLDAAENAAREASEREEARNNIARSRAAGSTYIMDAMPERKLKGGLIDSGYRTAQRYFAERELEGLREREQTVAALLNQEQAIINTQISNLGLKDKIESSNANITLLEEKIRQLTNDLANEELSEENQLYYENLLVKSGIDLDSQRTVLENSNIMLEDMLAMGQFGRETYTSQQRFLQQEITQKEMKSELLRYSRKDLMKLAFSEEEPHLVDFIADRQRAIGAFNEAWISRHQQQAENTIANPATEETDDNPPERTTADNEDAENVENNEHSPDDIQIMFNEDENQYELYDGKHPEKITIAVVALKDFKGASGHLTRYDSNEKIALALETPLISILESEGYITDTSNRKVWKAKAYEMMLAVAERARSLISEQEEKEKATHKNPYDTLPPPETTTE